MKIFLYSLRQACRLRIYNLLKIIPLSLGLLIGIISMCNVVYYYSFDRELETYDNLQFLNIDWRDGENPLSIHTTAPMAPELMEKIPYISKATRFNYIRQTILHENNSFFSVGLNSDSLFFDLFPFEIISGNPQKVFEAGELMVSQGLATKLISENSQIIGEVITIGKDKYTIGGVFHDIPRNSHLYGVDFIAANKSINQFNIMTSNDSFFTFFKTSQHIDREELDKAINDVLTPYFKNDSQLPYFFSKHISDYRKYNYSGDGELNTVIVYVGIFIMLLSAMNFVLMQINSLITRAKEVGIHKTNGANKAQVFSLVIWETIIYMLIALILTILLLFSFRAEIYNMIGNSYDEIFNINYLFVIGLVFILMIIVSGIIPAKLYSNISVNNLFVKFSKNNIWWKQILLFLQFTISMIIITTFTAVTLQYKFLINYNIGYKYDNLQYINFDNVSEIDEQVLKNQLLALPAVDMVTISDDIPNSGWGGALLKYNNDKELSSRICGVDPDFFETYGIDTNYGNVNNLVKESIIVNNKLLEMTNSTPGEYDFSYNGYNVVAVCEDFRNNLYVNMQPMIFTRRDTSNVYSTFTIKTKPNISVEQQNEINNTIKEVLPSIKHDIVRYQESINSMYDIVKVAKNNITLASIVFIIIMIIGVISYIGTEIKAQTREIAIRRTIGASPWQIIVLVCRRISVIAIIAATITIPASYILINNVLFVSFAESVHISWWLYALSPITIFAIIIISTYIQTNKLTHKNYVKIIGKL